MNINTLGIDIAKTVFQLHGIDKSGKTVLTRKLSRDKLLSFIRQLPPCLIVMEACGGSNYWSRQFQKIGHSVKLISPQYVKPFVKTNKSDANDAQAICEAASRPSMHFVAPKSIEQQDIQGLHRIRDRLIQARTALVNQTRGLLAEYGIVVSKSVRRLRGALPLILEDGENELTVESRAFIAELYQELIELEDKVQHYNDKLEAICQQQEACQRLTKIEGIAAISATAIVAAVGDASHFKNGRQMAAWFGLVPKQHSSGNRQQLLGISKRGNSYLRRLLVHGARSVVYRAKSKTDKKSLWINSLVQRCGANKACIALANKNARLICALLKNNVAYQAT